MSKRITLDPNLLSLSGPKPSRKSKKKFDKTKKADKAHNVNYEKLNLAGFGKPSNYAQRQISRWEKQWNLSKQRDIPEMNSIIEWLNKHLPEKCDSSIVHGDFRLGNLIFNRKTGEVPVSHNSARASPRVMHSLICQVISLIRQ